MSDDTQEMMRFFGHLLKGTFDHEEIFWFKKGFIKELMQYPNSVEAAGLLVKKKGYIVVDTRQGETKEDSTSLIVRYMKLETIIS